MTLGATAQRSPYLQPGPRSRRPGGPPATPGDPPPRALAQRRGGGSPSSRRHAEASPHPLLAAVWGTPRFPGPRVAARHRDTHRGSAAQLLASPRERAGRGGAAVESRSPRPPPQRPATPAAHARLRLAACSAARSPCGSVRIAPKAGASAAAGSAGRGARGRVSGAPARTETRGTAPHGSGSGRSRPRAAAAAGGGPPPARHAPGPLRALPVGRVWPPPPPARVRAAPSVPGTAAGGGMGGQGAGSPSPRGRARRAAPCARSEPAPHARSRVAPPPRPPSSLPPPSQRPEAAPFRALLAASAWGPHPRTPLAGTASPCAWARARRPAPGPGSPHLPRHRLWGSGRGGAQRVEMSLRFAKGRKLCHPAGDVCHA